jgi:hypothetical protein
MGMRMKSMAVIPNSPIEFLITGPYGGTDRVLVRSRDAGIDLIGIAANFESQFKRQLRSENILSRLLGGGRKLNAVISMPFSDIDVRRDSRKSSYQFVWSGYASPRVIDRVEYMFNKMAPLLKDLIADGNVEELEWALAPLILQCSEENERLRRQKKMSYWIMGAYSFVIVAILLFSSVTNQLKLLK